MSQAQDAIRAYAKAFAKFDAPEMVKIYLTFDDKTKFEMRAMLATKKKFYDAVLSLIDDAERRVQTSD